MDNDKSIPALVDKIGKENVVVSLAVGSHHCIALLGEDKI
jgi:hypothetical protein